MTTGRAVSRPAAHPRRGARAGLGKYLLVVRLHFADRWTFAGLPLLVLGVAFAINLMIWTIIGYQEGGIFSGALVSIFFIVALIGYQAISKSMPFAFALSVSRRTFYFGTIALIFVVGAALAAILTVLNLVETTTDGWGFNGMLFRIPWLLDGPWYQTFLSNSVGLILSFVLGMWASIIYTRFGLTGALIVYAGGTLLLVGAVAIITWQHWWSTVSEWMSTLTAPALFSRLAVLTVLLSIGGYLTVRRIVL